MRTTLILKDDVYARLEQEMRRTGKPLEELINHYVRLGLKSRPTAKPTERPAKQARPMSLQPGLSLESIPGLLEQLVGPMHR
ncbi:MAG TPA: hypothetical protein VLY04_23440 [Bryobacteraceae bacterium]|nr:hypothetical protein [Bryobacteraceae bacterium]